MSVGRSDPARVDRKVKPDDFDGKNDFGLMAREVSRSQDLEELSAQSNALHATRNDQKDMDRMGKIPQLRRNFRQVSAISFVCVMVSTWEVVFLANTQGLTDGGLAGLFWSYLWTMVGFGLIAASLAEMASMAPTSGGMYHWVSEYAPPNYQNFLSYMTGWMAVLSWQAGNASGAFIAGTVIQAIATVDNPTYQAANWQGTLIVFATVLLIWVINVFLIKWLPLLQNMLMWVYVLAFIAIITVLWVKAPLNTAAEVFTTFANGGGWESVGLSVMIGQITAIYALVGSDSAAHMSEETRDAGLAVPKAIMWSFGINALLGLVFLVTLLFAITDINGAINDPSGYPFIWVLMQALPGSLAGINAITAVMVILSLASNISFNASTSRQMFAFARDGGLPFSAWIAKVHPTLLVPINAISLTCLISCALALIDIGSNVAFNAIISLMLVALMSTYMVSIGCVLWRRTSKSERYQLPKARWSMGRWTGVIVNIGALLYSVFAFFWCFWPNTTGSGAANFNWSVVLFLGVGLVALVMWFVEGRNGYRAPVATVVGRDER